MPQLRLSRNEILLFLPIIFIATVLGTILVQSSYLGLKWLGLVIMAYLLAAIGLVFKDKRLFLVLLAAACVPIGFQYNVWTHGSKFNFQDHFGGALAEPVINLIDLPIALLILMWIADLRIGSRFLPKWTRMDTLLSCLLGYSLFSIYNTECYLLFFFEVFRYLKYFAFYWMMRTYLDGPIYYWGILGINIAVLSLQGIVSLLQYFFLFSFPIPVGGVTGPDADLVDNELILRVTGILGHSNTFSAYLTVICSMCLIVLFARIKLGYKLATLPMMLFGLISLVLTFSRNGWMVFTMDALIIGFWALKTKRLHPGHVVGIGSACIFLVGVLFVSGIFDTVMTRVFRTDDGAFDSRSDLVLVAFEMIKSHPVIGIGLNSFEENMIHYDPYHITHIIRQPVHNGFLLVAAETGIPALLILIFIVIGYIKMSGRLLKRDTEIHFAVGLTGLATFAGLGIANIFDVTLRKESVAGTIVVVAAMVATLYAKTNNQDFQKAISSNLEHKS